MATALRRGGARQVFDSFRGSTQTSVPLCSGDTTRSLEQEVASGLQRGTVSPPSGFGVVSLWFTPAVKRKSPIKIGGS